MNNDRISEVYKGEIWSTSLQDRARRRIHWLCSQARGEKVLDIGCSQGIASIILAQEGFQVTGIDIQQDRIDYARLDHAKEPLETRNRLTFMVANAADLPFESETFDSVLLGEVLEHLAVPQRVLQESSRVLKPGGVMVITTPYGLSPHHDHKQTFGPSGVWHLLSESFTITSFDIVDRYFRVVAIKEPTDVSGRPTLHFDSLGPLLDTALLQVDSELLEARKKARFREDELATLRTQIEESGGTNRRLTRDLEKREAEVRSLNKVAAGALETRDVARAQISRLSDQLGVRTRKIQALSARVTKLERDRSVLRNRWEQERWKRRSLMARKWWRIGLALGAIKRRPWRVFVAPFDIVSIVFSKSSLPPRPVATKTPDNSMQLATLPDTPSTSNGPTSLDHRMRRLLAPAARPTMSELRVAAISDEMTEASFAPECNWITFRPDNWQIVAESHEPHLVFVESAWRGNGGSWEYRVGTYSHPESLGLPDLSGLVSWARLRGIPTVFWNKEDPVHFDKFRQAASFFDVICTSDAGRIDAYRSLPDAVAKKIVPLQFAAQPSIHNPISLEQRVAGACFAGTYYANRHHDRKAEMEMLLDGAMDTGLQIFDRMAGSANPDFAFPDRFSSKIVGAVPYAEIVRLYKRYRVFLNTNSVSGSPTMFSRRVFELLGCGTPVVSTPSVGMQEEFGDIVAVVETEAEVRAAVEKLLNDDDHWNRVSAAGIRKVMREHCYAHRLEAVCQAAGIQVDPPYSDDVALLVIDARDIEMVADMASSQTLAPKEILVAVPNEGSFTAGLNLLSGRLPGVDVRAVPKGVSLEGDVAKLLAASAKSRLSVPYSRGALLAKTVIEDFAACTRFAPGALLGAPLSPGDAHTYVDQLDPAVVAMPTDLLRLHGWSTGSSHQPPIANWFRVGVPVYAMRRDATGSVSL